MIKLSSFIYTSIAFIFCLSMVSCSQNTEDFEGTELRGTVVQYGTKDPVQNALVPLLGVESQGVLQNAILYLVDTARTNVNGEFYFRTFEEATTFEIGKITADGYYSDQGNEQRLVFPGENQFYNPEFVLNPIGWVHLIIKDVDSLDHELQRVGSSFIPGTNISLFDHDKIYDVRANRDYLIGHKKTESDPLIDDTVYVPAFDTITYMHLY